MGGVGAGLSVQFLSPIRFGEGGEDGGGDGMLKPVLDPPCCHVYPYIHIFEVLIPYFKNQLFDPYIKKVNNFFFDPPQTLVM